MGEVEKLVVRLVGDGLQFRKMMESAQHITKETVGAVKTAATAMSRAMLASVKRIQAGLRGLQSSLRGIAGTLSLAGTGLTLGWTLPIAGAGAAMIKMASDAEETESKFMTVFSNIAGSATAMADHLDAAYGMSRTESRRMLSDTADLLSGFGFTQTAALEMSNAVQQLSVDLASFQNLEGGAARASDALTKALLGERESAKALGIAILEEDVKAQVALNTSKGLTHASERQAKAFATLQLAQQQSKNAIGDYAKTQSGFANQVRELVSDIKDVAGAFGGDLLPIAQTVLGWVRQFVQWLKDLNPAIRKVLLVVGALAASLGPLLLVFGGIAAAGAAVVGFLATFGVVLLKIAAVIGAVVAGVAALGAGVIAVARWLGVDFAQAWGTATDAAQTFLQKVVGFFSNFSQNMRILWAWFKDNWRDVLRDVGNLALTAITNMVHNMGVGIRTIFRLWVAWRGFMTLLWQRVFSQEFLMAVVDGMTKALDLIADFGKKIWESIKAGFTGEEVDLSDFAKQIQADFEKGASDLNFLNTAKDIIKEEAGNLKLLEGFESSIVEGPKLITTIADDAKAAKEAIEDIGETPGMPTVTKTMKKAKDEAKGLAKETGKINKELRDIQGVEIGSAEAMARATQYLALRPTGAGVQTVTPGATTAGLTATPAGSPAAQGKGASTLHPATARHYSIVEALLRTIATNTNSKTALEPAGV